MNVAERRFGCTLVLKVNLSVGVPQVGFLGEQKMVDCFFSGCENMTNRIQQVFLMGF